jgi:hypothetical protein
MGQCYRQPLYEIPCMLYRLDYSPNCIHLLSLSTESQSLVGMVEQCLHPNKDKAINVNS